MNDAKLYNMSNSLQKKGTLDCLNEFAKKIHWRNHASVIDIGCGDGSTTAEILMEYLPEDLKSLLGVDVNENMVQFAEVKYRGDRTLFMRLNIEDHLPQELVGKFDHAFSFYAIHWMKKQKGVFTNIYNLLAEGGSCLLIFISHIPISEAYRTLSRSAKWGTYLKGIEKFLSPYHDSQEPEKEIRDLLKTIGFRNIYVRNQEISFAFNNWSHHQDAIKAVNVFDFPLGTWDEFYEDYLEVISELKMVKIDSKEPFSVTYEYKLVTITASK